MNAQLFPTRASLRVLGAVAMPLSVLAAACGESGGGPDVHSDFAKELEAVGTYQAEEHTFQKGCSVSASHAGYTGSGFMDYGANNSMVEWNHVRAPEAGDYELVFRYANGSGSPRPAAVTLNDSEVGQMEFQRTGGWDSWSTVTLQAEVRAGNNKIRVTANTGRGGPNLDRLDLLRMASASTAGCTSVREGHTASLQCPAGQSIASIDLASYGTASGSCEDGHELGECHAGNTAQTVEDQCLGRASCAVPANNRTFGDPCPGVGKGLQIQYTCRAAGQDGEGDGQGDGQGDGGDGRPANLVLLAGQSNMEGNVDSALFSTIVRELNTAPVATRAQRVADALKAWYLGGNRQEIGVEVNNRISDEEAAELVRLQAQGLVHGRLDDPQGREDVMCSWHIPGPDGNLETRQPLQNLSVGCGNPFGPELVMGQYLGNQLERPTSLVKVARGGTTLYADWLSPTAAARRGRPVGALYRQLQAVMGRTNSAPKQLHPSCSGQRCDWQAFVWFQGENDVFVDEARPEYAQNLRDLIADVRDEIGNPHLPVILVQVGYWASNIHAEPLVANAQRTVAREDRHVHLVTTDDLSRFYHYDPAAQMIMGERMGRMLLDRYPNLDPRDTPVGGDDPEDPPDSDGPNRCAAATEGSTASLSCPDDGVIANIDFASYGTPAGTCDDGHTLSTCHASPSLATVAERCVGQNSCSVEARNSLFSDPCPGVGKRLRIEYTCAPQTVAVCAQAGEGASTTLQCPADLVIRRLDFASYGTPTGSCDQGYAQGACHAPSSLEALEGPCVGQSSCSVRANNGMFGDPCPGVRKQLRVAYTCGPAGAAGDDNDDGGSVPDDDPGCSGSGVGDVSDGLDYFGSSYPCYMSIPDDYEVVGDPNVNFFGGLDSYGHVPTAQQGAGKFVFNRIYRASKHGVGSWEQYGIFHWWLGSYGSNSIEGGLWVNPRPAGPHYYPTLHIAGVGYPYHTCSDVQGGSGMGNAYLGDRWLAMIQFSNRVLTVPGVNVAFDKDQAPYEEDNGLWLGWGWSYLNLAHPRGFKFWMSVVESYDYQGPINGYVPEYFNWVDPSHLANGSYQDKVSSRDPFGTFATHGSAPNGGIGNEQYTHGFKIGDDIYYLPVPQVPSHKGREYLIKNIQSIESSTMEAYSQALRSGSTFDPLIDSQFLRMTGNHSSTHSQLKIHEQIGGQEHLTVIRPPYSFDHDAYGGYVEWSDPSRLAQSVRSGQNGYLYYRKTDQRWPADGNFVDHEHLYTGELIDPPDNVRRVPRVDAKFISYKERDTRHPDFANWNTGNRRRYRVALQNGSIATYVWFKFTEQPAMLSAAQNWPQVYTKQYLQQLQRYVESLHTLVAETSKANPSDPVFINYRNDDDENPFDPHLVKIDPTQMVVPPPGFEIGYVPVIISVYHPAERSANGTGLISEPEARCSNAAWTDTYFPEVLR